MNLHYFAGVGIDGRALGFVSPEEATVSVEAGYGAKPTLPPPKPTLEELLDEPHSQDNSSCIRLRGR